MADKFGAVALPPSPTDPLIGDPALYYIGHYLKAVFNARLASAWRAAVAPNAVGDVATAIVPVRTVRFDNPVDGEFNEADLPALFLFRGESLSEIRADGWDVLVTPITVEWVFPASTVVERTQRINIRNAIEKVAYAAIESGRHASYVIQGDTDPKAAASGSFIYGPAYVNPVSLDFKGAKLTTAALRMSSGAPMRGYPMVDMRLSIVEVLEESIDGFAVQDSLDLTTTTEDDPPVETGHVTLD